MPRSNRALYNLACAHALNAEKADAVRVLERGNPHFDEPTLGVRVGAELFYVANSQYEQIREDGSLIAEKLKPPVILRAPLPWLVP